VANIMNICSYRQGKNHFFTLRFIGLLFFYANYSFMLK
jgi:hypothetical protein